MKKKEEGDGGRKKKVKKGGEKQAGIGSWEQIIYINNHKTEPEEKQGTNAAAAAPRILVSASDIQ